MASALLLFITLFTLNACSDSDSASSGPPAADVGESLPNPPDVGPDVSSIDGVETHRNASAVYWNKELWIFYPTEDPNDEIHYKKWNGSSFTSTVTMKVGDTIEEADSPITPIAADKILYVFFIGMGGKADYVYLDPTTNKWQGLYRVENGAKNAFPYHVSIKPAVAFDRINRRLEVYYVPDSTGTIYYAYQAVDKDGRSTGSWQGFAPIKDRNGDNALGLYLSALSVQIGDNAAVTYLAYQNIKTTAPYLSKIQYENGVAIINNTVQMSNNSTGTPALVDLGEEKMAMVFLDDHENVSYRYFDKATGQWGAAQPYKKPSNPGWYPTAAVFYKPADDPSAYGGKRYDAILYTFYGNESGISSTRWKMGPTDFLGYWKPVAATQVDWATDAGMALETFHLWPMLFLVDAPPFVNNGKGDGEYKCEGGYESCTEITLNLENTDKTVMSGEISAGLYAKTKEKSPLTFEFDVGYSGAREKGNSYTVSTSDPLRQTPYGLVMAFYLAPKFKTLQLQWFHNDMTPTQIDTYQVQVTGITPMKMTFEPNTGPVTNGQPYPNVPQPYLKIPWHVGETDRARIATYTYPTAEGYDPATYDPFAMTTQTWATGSPATVGVTIASESSTSQGCYAELTLGAGNKYFGMGVEGSFEFNYTRAHESSAQVETHLDNPSPSQSGDVNNLHVTMYWLKPDSKGYWNPQNSAYHIGDSPSFVTFSATAMYQ
jgi:hypothetical protein